eukprot:m.90317 g.90317  ORF g.90317 m.90317 type:complete len:60 (-) comp13261_c1_seq2:34-213(-)
MAGKMWQPLVVEGENSWYVRLRQEMRTSNRAYIAGGTTVNGTKSDTVAKQDMLFDCSGL